MIVLTCECGEIFHADEKHIGYSIRCSNCQRIIFVARKSEPSYIASRDAPIIEVIHPEPVHKWWAKYPLKPLRSLLRNRLVPLLGIIALVTGVVLTIINLRARTSDTVGTQVSGVSNPTPPADVSDISAAIHPAPNAATKSLSPTPHSAATPAIKDTSTSPFTFVTTDQPNPAPPTPAEPPETVRYPTGTNLMRPRSASGRGILRISNGTDSDAIARLADAETNVTVRLVYIQANSDGEIGNISPGNYILKFALGNGYYKESGRFLYAQSFAKFVETLDFREYRVDDEIRWSNFDVTLNPVLGGTARTSTISASDFYDH